VLERFSAWPQRRARARYTGNQRADLCDADDHRVDQRYIADRAWDEAARFSFLLGLPAIALAGFKELWEFHRAHLDARIRPQMATMPR
jgi:hypothetical protein